MNYGNVVACYIHEEFSGAEEAKKYLFKKKVISYPAKNNFFVTLFKSYDKNIVSRSKFLKI